MSGELGPGWGFPGSSRKAHYFPADDPTMSLCRKWGFYMGERYDDKHDHSENCAECVRKRERSLVQHKGGQE